MLVVWSHDQVCQHELWSSWPGAPPVLMVMIYDGNGGDNACDQVWEPELWSSWPGAPPEEPEHGQSPHHSPILPKSSQTHPQISTQVNPHPHLNCPFPESLKICSEIPVQTISWSWLRRFVAVYVLVHSQSYISPRKPNHTETFCYTVFFLPNSLQWGLEWWIIQKNWIFVHFCPIFKCLNGERVNLRWRRVNLRWRRSA